MPLSPPTLVVNGVDTWAELGGKPTTISGFGLIDAQPLDPDLTAIAALSTAAYGRSLLTQIDAEATRTLLELAYGITAGTVAQGNDSRITGAVQASSLDVYALAALANPPNAANGFVTLDGSSNLAVSGSINFDGGSISSDGFGHLVANTFNGSGSGLTGESADFVAGKARLGAATGNTLAVFGSGNLLYSDDGNFGAYYMNAISGATNVPDGYSGTLLMTDGNASGVYVDGFLLSSAFEGTGGFVLRAVADQTGDAIDVKYLTIANAGSSYLTIIDAASNYSPVPVSNDLAGQTAANASVLSVTPSVTGTYRIGAYLTVISRTLDVVQVSVTYTDETSTSRTLTMSGLVAATGVAPITSVDIRAKSGVAIVVSTALTTGGGSINYDIGATIQKLN